MTWKNKPVDSADYDSRWLARVLGALRKTPAGCWLWEGARRPSGYGHVAYKNNCVTVHRQVYQLTRGVALPNDVYVLHSCDVRNCCNPDHLRAGTQKENVADCVIRGRHHEKERTHCDHGHEFTAENTSYYLNGKGFRCRRCKTCERERMQRKRAAA